MKKHIHILGASGSGTTTIAREVAKRIGYNHFDSDNYFWLPTEEPFTVERDNTECLNLMKKDLLSSESWILSGSITGWAESLLPLFDLVVFVTVAHDIRIDRIKKREFERYGDRILPGGDKHESSSSFVDWASSYDAGTQPGRSIKKHEEWLKTVACTVLKIENINLQESIEKVISYL